MQAQLPVSREARVRALVALLICALVLTLGSAVRTQHTEAHGARHNAVLTTAPIDSPSTLLRTPTHGDLTAPPVITAVRAWTGVTSDSSPSANSRTSHSSPGRGPPVQALA